MKLAYILCQHNNIEIAFNRGDCSQIVCREGCEPVSRTGWPTYSERELTLWPEVKAAMLKAIEDTFGSLRFKEIVNLPDMQVSERKQCYTDIERHLAFEAKRFIKEDL
jgi:hypothetical protein